MVRDQVGALGERDAKRLCRGEEHTVLQHTLRLKVWAHRGGVDVVLLLTHLLRVVVPVPCFDRVTSHLLEIFLLFPRVSCGGWSELAEHVRDGLRGFRRLIRRDIAGVRVEAEKSRALSP